MSTPTRSPFRLAGHIKRYGSTILAALLLALLPATSLSSQAVPQRASFQNRTSQIELQMWELVNRDRADPSYSSETRGRAPALQWDDRLAAVARMHSEEMARDGYFSHEGADGSSPANRVSMAGIKWRSTGENIANCRGVSEAESTFMNEPKFQQNHRWNILNVNYTHVGVGVARAPDGSLYITQEFAQLR
ncbi:MAG TPA: CAP domain-containing protein [Candidatus Acidoferrales bacterium]